MKGALLAIAIPVVLAGSAHAQTECNPAKGASYRTSDSPIWKIGDYAGFYSGSGAKVVLRITRVEGQAITAEHAMAEGYQGSAPTCVLYVGTIVNSNEVVIKSPNLTHRVVRAADGTLTLYHQRGAVAQLTFRPPGS